MGTYVRLNYQNRMEYARNTFFFSMFVFINIYDTANNPGGIDGMLFRSYF